MVLLTIMLPSSTILILISSMASLSYGQQQHRPNMSFDNYVSSKGDFSIDYLANWTIKEKNRFDAPEYPNLIIANGDSRYGSPRLHISFAQTNASTLELVERMFDRDAKIDALKPNVVESINLTKYNIDGEQAGTYIYSALFKIHRGSSEIPIDSQTIVTTHNGMIYAFTFLAPGDEFDLLGFTKVKERMIDSIKWLR